MNRRLGIIVLLIGLAGFVFGTVQRGGYDTMEGAIKTAVSSSRSVATPWTSA